MTTTQHAARSCAANTEGLIVSRTPSRPTSYDDRALAAPPKASETISRPRVSNANPNGVAPFEGCAFGPDAIASRPTV